MPGHGGMRGFQALRGGKQAAAALQLQKITQVIPVEHDTSIVRARVVLFKNAQQLGKN
ncbi:Uncharacterised protein [Mycobacterium tuberculosis]|nr:Uncharacterised protein [Mycobacterium tuberculosis]